MEWITINVMASAIAGKRMWSLKRSGELPRLVIADTEEEARTQVPDGATWDCKLLEPEELK